MKKTTAVVLAAILLAVSALFPAFSVCAADAGFSLSFDSNGGRDVPDAVTGIQTFVIPEDKPIWPGYVFTGWAKTADAEEAEFSSGDTVTLTEDTVLYAVWEYRGNTALASITADKMTVSAGDEVTVTVSAETSDDMLMGAKLPVVYDAELFDFEGAEACGDFMFNADSSAKGTADTFLIIFGLAGEGNVPLFTVTFRAKAEGEAEFSVGPECFVFNAENDYILTTQGCGVTVLAKKAVAGDVTGDGLIRANDARRVLRIAAELEAADGCEAAADVDRDGEITAEDARRILRAAAELEDPSLW